MSQHEPEYVRAFPEDDPARNRRRGWLIAALAAAAAAIAVALVFVLWPRGGEPDPNASPQPTSSATATPTPTPSNTPTATPTAGPTPAPTDTTGPVTPPPPADPDLGAFTGRVGPVLDDADTGFGMLAGTTGQNAVQIVEQLQQDAQRLSDSPPPSSIADDWRAGLDAYSTSLDALRSTYASGGDAESARQTSIARVEDLRALLG